MFKKNQQTYFPMYWRSHSPKNADPLVSQFVTFETLFHGDQIGRSSTQPKPSCRTDPQVDESMGKCHGKWMFKKNAYIIPISLPTLKSRVLLYNIVA